MLQVSFIIVERALVTQRLENFSIMDHLLVQNIDLVMRHGIFNHDKPVFMEGPHSILKISVS